MYKTNRKLEMSILTFVFFSEIDGWMGSSLTDTSLCISSTTVASAVGIPLYSLQ